VQLMASHMMDLAPVYDQREDDEDLLPFRSQQLPRMALQQHHAQGRMLFFAAYNPFRDHWQKDPDAGRGQALEIVKSGVQKHGAYGIKFYPPSGYRPIGNVPPRRSFALFTRSPGRQWDARYTSQGKPLTGGDLDERTLKLFTWCQQQDLPVFAHCGTGEFEARKEYGVQMANPDFWIQLLEKHKNLHTLRLCLGHAGGPDFWFGGGKYAEWGAKVHFLCTNYPNVYAEFGAHDMMVDDKARAVLVAKLQSLLSAPREKGKYDFGKKLMYGSDWFMPMPGVRGREQYLLASQVAALEIEAGAVPRRPDFYRDFMYRNSLTYLNAARRQHDPRLPAALRRNLSRLLAAASF
jgi:predicted TIM-barrel fold metal-dependent hydrolase